MPWLQHLTCQDTARPFVICHFSSLEQLLFACSLLHNMPLAECKSSEFSCQAFVFFKKKTGFITYAFAISGATLLCRRLLKLKRRWDVRIPIHPYNNIWSDQDKTAAHVQNCVKDRKLWWSHLAAWSIAGWTAGGIFQSFRQPEYVRDRPKIVTSLLTVRGHRDMITGYCTPTVSNQSTHPGNLRVN